ncbi:sodium-coupled neutral amino acid symporter 1-like [Pristis pectinata]|uniref:sodium-coupled neutral amino acid symporter 1-like n=1 Tax=Pristis pectinata TaxID=685728 RepID=UPI00223DEE9A|nr:sodium-coupled neutral amino acid symporter 1-like [Pristis pectinata]
MADLELKASTKFNGPETEAVEGGMKGKSIHNDAVESTSSLPNKGEHSGSTSMKMSVFNLSNAIMGSGLLGLSYAMANTGIIPFIFLLVAIALMSLVFNSPFAATLQLKRVDSMFFSEAPEFIVKLSSPFNASHLSSMVYETLGQLAFGKLGKFAVFGSTSLQNIGAILSYLLIVKNQLPHVIQSFTYQENSEVWYLNGNSLVICVTLAIILPLCLFKNLGYLGYTSGLSLFCMIFFLIVVIYKMTQLPCPLISTNPSNFSCTDMCSPKYFVWNNKTVYALPTVAFAFVCHPSVLPIYSELKNHTCKKMRLVSVYSFGSMFIMYLLTAIFGYLTFFGNVKEELLHSYTDPNDRLILLIRLAVIVAVILTVPVLLFTVRSSIVLLLFKAQFSWIQHIIVTGSLLFVANLLVIYIPTIKDVFAVIGSTSANMLIFILPALLYLKLVKNESQGKWQKIGAVAFLIVGIMFIMFTVPLIFVEWNERRGNYTIMKSCSE